jgi:predicted tellurium resistance membrane protein TerC
VLKLMDRFPVVITLGGALLGWIAGEMIFTDVALKDYVAGLPKWSHYVSAAAGALLVVAIGKALARRKPAGVPPVVELPLEAPAKNPADSH